MNIKNIKALFYTLFLIAVFFGSSVFSARAANTVDMSGYAWSGNIGWISLNSTNTGAGSGAAYKVVIDNMPGSTFGNISGNAWSSNVGWLSFDRSVTGAPPSDDVGNGSGPIAKIINGSIVGWARFIGACQQSLWNNNSCSGNGSSIENGGAWDGWVSLSKKSGGIDYGIIIGGCTVQGYAWGSNVVGWIAFSGVSLSDCTIVTEASSATLSINGTLANGFSVSKTNPYTYRLSQSESKPSVEVSWSALGVTPNTCVLASYDSSNNPTPQGSVDAVSSRLIPLNSTLFIGYDVTCQKIGSINKMATRKGWVQVLVSNSPPATCLIPSNTNTLISPTGLCEGSGTVPGPLGTRVVEYGSCPAPIPAPDSCTFECATGYLVRGNACVKSSKTIER